MKWTSLTCGLVTLLAVTAHANPTQDSVAQELEAKLKAAAARATPKTSPNGTNVVSALGKLAQAPADTCVETKRISFGRAYVMTTTAEGKACRIYDLSFPTVQAMFARKKVAQLPIDQVTAKDYLDWFKGREDEVLRRRANANAVPRLQTIPQDSWVSQLAFKNSGSAFGWQTMNAPVPGMRTNFSAADLDVGEFKLSEEQRRMILELGAEVRSLNGEMTVQSGEDFWMTLADKPQTFLEKIRFVYNDAERVYDVFIEGEFLPIKGPVALVDFEKPYKPAVEALIRSIVGSLLQKVAALIPEPMVNRIVSIAITDGFEFLEAGYTYQQAMLEDALRQAALNRTPGLEMVTQQSALNNLFGIHSNLTTNYIMAVAQGKKFDWMQMDDLGRTARYTEEKRRLVRKANMNSRLVLKNGCKMQLMNSAYGVCSKANAYHAVYALEGSNTVLVWDLGAPMIYRFGMPSEVALKRGGAWLLSAAARVFELPIGGLKGTLVDSLKNYSRAGILEEARFRHYLMNREASGGAALTPAEKKLVSWLYIQNLNPFLPKSASGEQSMISGNAALMN